MSTFNGPPAHILLNHFVVVLAPLTAILAILCALWPAARRRPIWLVLPLAVGTLVLIPLTTNSGGWLAARVGPSPALTTHERFGDPPLHRGGAGGHRHAAGRRAHPCPPWCRPTASVTRARAPRGAT
jgi:hypothetical protein